MNEQQKQWIRVVHLLNEVDDVLVHKFFDLESMEMLDIKERVLQELIDGKTPAEIPEYYMILENYPKDGGIWD